MKTLTIELTDEEAETLEKWGDIIERDLSAFIQDEVIPDYIAANEGSLADNLVCRIYDTLEEAKTAAAKLDSLVKDPEDESGWLYYRRSDGRISLDIKSGWREPNEGEELIEA